MAHLFESGFFVKDEAWHKLGNLIQEAPTTEDGIRLAGLDWKVRMEKLFLADKRLVDHHAIIRESDNKILSVTGPQWRPLQNIDAFKFFDPFLKSGECELEAAGSLREGKVIWVLAKIKKCHNEIIKGDEIQRYFMLSNGHYSGKSVSIGFVDIRVVCANTMAMAEQSSKSKLMRVMHSKNLMVNLDTVQSTVKMANQSFEANMEKLKELTRRGINQDDVKKFVDVIFFDSRVADLSTRQENKRSFIVNKLEELIETGIGSDIKGVQGTRYSLYQAVTEYFTHHDGNDYSQRFDKLWNGANKGKNEKSLEYLLIA